MAGKQDEGVEHIQHLMLNACFSTLPRCHLRGSITAKLLDFNDMNMKLVSA